VVSAPAGYGKSTLVSHWVQARDAPCAWLSLDESDSDPRVFLPYLLAAIREVVPGACPKTDALSRGAQLPPISELTVELINELDELPSSFSLVLDDYDRLATTSVVHELIAELAQRPPRAMRLICLSRSDPPLPLSRLRARGQLRELRLGDLRFSDAEAAELIYAAAGFRASEAALGNLQRQMEGWAVGLRLVSLLLSQVPAPDEFLQGLRGNLRAISDYLMQEVIARQPRGLTEWLLRVSVLDRFCADLCQAVCASDKNDTTDFDGEGFMRTLQERSLFVIPLDTEGRWFRLHHVFRDLLRSELERRITPEAVSDLRGRAAKWFVDAGLIDEAIAQALDANDVDGAANLVEAHRCDENQVVPWYFQAKWLPRLPGDLKRERPGLLMAQAWLLYTHGRWAEIPAILEVVEAAYEEAPGDPLVQGELSFFRGHRCFYEIEDTDSREYFEQALDCIPAAFAGHRSLVQAHYGLALQKSGEPRKAIEFFQELTRGGDLRDSSVVGRLATGIAMVHLLEADLFRAEAQIEDAKRFVLQTLGAPMEAWWLYLSAGVAFWRNELGELEGLLDRVEQNRYQLYLPLVMDALALRATGLQERGDREGANRVVARMRELSFRMRSTAGVAVAIACQAQLALMSGDVQQARERVSRLDLAADQGWMAFWIHTPRLIACRVLIAEGGSPRLESALTRLAQYERENRATHNRLKLIEVLAWKACALHRLGRSEQALESLLEAATLARPGQVIRPFVEAGPMMAELIPRSSQPHDAAGATAWLQDVLAEHSAESSGLGPLDAATISSRSAFLAETLTNRELDILSLLVHRMRNKEIAAALSISPETVKSHLREIYLKLRVTDRREAAVLAQRELGPFLSRPRRAGPESQGRVRV
jgi:LuxR family maltose regulon positive regulatory protein